VQNIVRRLNKHSAIYQT